MRRTGNVFSPTIPLAGVLAAGLVHAAFEDWLFAAGYYLCVFFWALAFIMIDVFPAAAPSTVSPCPVRGRRGLTVLALPHWGDNASLPQLPRRQRWWRVDLSAERRSVSFRQNRRANHGRCQRASAAGTRGSAEHRMG